MILLKILNYFKDDPAKMSILILIVIGGVLRFVGTNPGYNPYHADETMSYASAWQMITNQNLDPKRYDYPSLIPIINLLFFIAIFIPLNVIKYLIFNYQSLSSFLDIPIFLKQILEKGDLQAMFWSRYVTAFFSTLTLPLVYIIAHKIYKNKLIGIFAVITLAVNYKTVLNSHFGLPDIYNAFFFLLSLYLSLNLLERPIFKNYILCGIGVALSIAIKFQVFTIIPFFLVHLYIIFSSKGSWWLKTKKFFTMKFLLSLTLIPFILLLLNPYHLANFDEFKHVNEYTLLRYYAQRSKLYGLSFIYYVALTPAVAVTSIIGLLVGFKQNFFRTAVMMSIPLSFLYTILFQIGGTGFTRNYISIIPFFAICSGVFFYWLYNFLFKISANKYLSTILVFLIIAVSLKLSLDNSLILVQNFQKDWGMVSLNKYLEGKLKQKEIKLNSKVAAHQWDFSTVLSKPNSIVEKFELVPLSLESNYFLKELQEKNVDYALLGLDIVNTQNSWWMTQLERVGYEFWNNRIMYLSNQPVSLAVNELSQYTLFPVVKPWQAPDNNYLFIKVPKQLEFKTRQIVDYTFDNNENSWNKVDGNFGKGNNLVYDALTGYEKGGSLNIKPGNPFILIVRYISPVFKVKPGYGYQTEAWIKAASVIDKKNRDGFLRMDFYQEEPKVFDETTQSIKTALSERYFGNSEWLKLKISSQAPNDAKFATISFQVASPNTTGFWIDNVTIFESLVKIDDVTILYKVPDEVLYPYTQGGL